MNDYEIISKYKKYEPLFGNWHIKNFVGEGGFAKVFEIVRNDYGVEYTSALKIITVSKTKSEINSMKSEGMSDMEIKETLKGIVEDTVKEIELMYKLKGNGNIVGYEDHEVIEHKDGWGFDILIKMEFLTSLGSYIRLKGGQIAKREIIKLGIDICKALEACQKYNIIHRDIKADNIFVSNSGDFKLGDFGIARIIERKDMDLSKKGTFTYMAPEVYKGQTYTSAVDIYSLGMVMYRLMNNNRAPFLPAYPKTVSLDERDRALMMRMSGEKLPKPNQVEKSRLTEIVMKACAYRPEERYSSPIFMRQELEAILYDQNEITKDEQIMIYDEWRENSNYSNNSHNLAGTPSDNDATEVLREDDATEVLREEDVATDIKMLCKKCGNTISRDVAYCPVCGASQKDEQASESGKGINKKAKMVAGVCAAVLVVAVIIGVAVSYIYNGNASDSQDESAISDETEETNTIAENSSETGTIETDTNVTDSEKSGNEKPTSENSVSQEYGNWKENILMLDIQNDIDENSKVLGSDITRKEIITVTFLDSLSEMPDTAWDVSADKSGKVMAWTLPTNGGYDLYIGGEGGVAAGESAANLFHRYINAEQIRFNNNFHTENTTNMGWIFVACEKISTIDVSGFDTSNVTTMENMFGGCAKLSSLDVSGFDTSKVTNMRWMFNLCSSLTNLDLSSFDTSNVENMRQVFGGCENLSELAISDFDTSKVTDMSNMFVNCNNLTELDLSGFDTSNVTTMENMFGACEKVTKLDLKGFNTSKVTTMRFMFNKCSSLSSVDVSSFDTSKVTNMSFMFNECSSLSSVDVSGFDTSNVTDMGAMFQLCSSLSSVDVSGFNTSNVTNVGSMFSVCTSLPQIDVSNFAPELVANMGLLH